MPGMDGIAARSALRELATSHVTVPTTFQADEYVMNAIRAGADGSPVERHRTHGDRQRSALRGCRRTDALSVGHPHFTLTPARTK